MTSAAHLRKGWCPGALRPMRSGDGLLVRVRPRAGSFSIAALRAIASTAAQFGSGEIDLTNRGNLQLRGISDETLDRVLTALDAAELLDRSAEAEAARNLIVDPLSGLDPARTNIRELASSMEDVLVRDPHLWSLPGKFGFSFSGTDAPQVGGRSTDIMISAAAEGLSVCLDGAPNVRCELARQAVVYAAHQLALTFIALNAKNEEFRRMRDTVARLGAATIFAMAGLKATHSAATSSFKQVAPVGVLAHNGEVFAVGVGLPFGRITAAQLTTLCTAADAAGARDVHPSPQRALVFPVANVQHAASLLRDANAAQLITDISDVRLTMDVCPGSAACRNAGTDTRRDAQALAETFGDALAAYSLHISGCVKGCARRTDASFTLVGHNGQYDIIRNGSVNSSSVIETVNAEDISAALAHLIAEPA